MCGLEVKKVTKSRYSSEMGTLGFTSPFISNEPLLITQLLKMGFDYSLAEGIHKETMAMNLGELLEVLE